MYNKYIFRYIIVQKEIIELFFILCTIFKLLTLIIIKLFLILLHDARSRVRHSFEKSIYFMPGRFFLRNLSHSGGAGISDAGGRLWIGGRRGDVWGKGWLFGEERWEGGGGTRR